MYTAALYHHPWHLVSTGQLFFLPFRLASHHVICINLLYGNFHLNDDHVSRGRRVKCVIEEMEMWRGLCGCGLSCKHLIFYSWVTCVTSAGFTGKGFRFTVSTEERVEALNFSFPLTQLSCTVQLPPLPPCLLYLPGLPHGFAPSSPKKFPLLSRVTLTASDRVTKGVPWSLDWMSVFK